MAFDSKYSAVTARTCALRSNRISGDTWKSLIEMQSSRDAIAKLSSIGLLSSHELSPADAEFELRQRFIINASKLVRFTEGSFRKALSCFIYYYDLLNLEKVICRLNGFSTFISERLYDTGRFGLFIQADLQSAGSIPVLGRVVKTSPFGKAFEDAADDYAREKDLPQFLASLEFSFFSRWIELSREAGLQKSALDVFLQMKTALIVMRLGARGERQHIIREWLSLYSRKTEADSLANKVDPLDLFNCVAGGERMNQQKKAPSSVSEANREASRRILSVARKTASKISFEASFPAGFLVYQQIEAENLVSLIEGKELGLTPDEIREFLVFI